MSVITIDLPDGRMNALVVKPRVNRGGAVVVIQEVFGVNDTMRAACEMVADMGFAAICPDLFWRVQPGIDLDAAKPEQFQQALGYMRAFNAEQGVADLSAALAYARSMPGGNGRAGTIGYCLGGRLAMMMAIRSDADVNVSYYGAGLDTLLPGIAEVRTPLVLHLAGNDALFPEDGQRRLLAGVVGHPHIAAYLYPGAEHAYARVGSAHYHGLAAHISNGRTAEAFKTTLCS